MLNKGSIGDYGSHYPVLAAVVARCLAMRSPIRVLELGAGDWSTPMLHYMCKATGSMLQTAETDVNWLERFKEYEGPSHQLSIVDSWEDCDLLAQAWDAVFVDCAPGEARHKAIEQLVKAGSVHTIVAHDSERDYGTGANYMYEKVTPLFKYVSEFRRFRPYTLIMSNVEPFHIEEVDRTWTPLT